MLRHFLLVIVRVSNIVKKGQLVYKLGDKDKVVIIPFKDKDFPIVIVYPKSL